MLLVTKKAELYPLMEASASPVRSANALPQPKVTPTAIIPKSNFANRLILPEA
jgi:hypothetical protein